MQRTARVVTTTVLTGLALAATLAAPNPSQATPLDLSGFTASMPSNVTESGGIISFIETFDAGALYFYNDAFLVPADAAALSFDYDFNLGSDDWDDKLEFNVNNTNQLTVQNNTIAGHFVFVLSGLRNQAVALDWGLIWGGDPSDGTRAGVYNIDLSTEPGTPVPEPATMLLMATGLAGLYGARRKKG